MGGEDSLEPTVCRDFANKVTGIFFFSSARWENLLTEKVKGGIP